MSQLGKHLNAADGFIKLRMFLEANEQLESIAPEQRTHSEVLRRRVKIYAALGKDDLLATVERELERRLAGEQRHDTEVASVEPNVITDEPGAYRAARRHSA